jgi:hypothetical protein
MSTVQGLRLVAATVLVVSVLTVFGYAHKHLIDALSRTPENPIIAFCFLGLLAFGTWETGRFLRHTVRDFLDFLRK